MKKGTCQYAKCKNDATSYCKRCQSTFYCSRECQQNHWTREHKFNCFECLPTEKDRFYIVLNLSIEEASTFAVVLEDSFYPLPDRNHLISIKSLVWPQDGKGNGFIYGIVSGPLCDMEDIKKAFPRIIFLNNTPKRPHIRGIDYFPLPQKAPNVFTALFRPEEITINF